MYDTTDGGLKDGRCTADAQITIDARDVLAGRWDEIHMEAGR